MLKGLIVHIYFEAEDIKNTIQYSEKNRAKLVGGFPKLGFMGKCFFAPKVIENDRNL